MNLFLYVGLILLYCCQATNRETVINNVDLKPEPKRTYDETIISIRARQKEFSQKHQGVDSELYEITDFWVKAISEDLYEHWQNTPWDFNGTARKPGEGPIACGYFVTTILSDMNFTLNRVKLAICPSSIMMKSVCSNQKIQNLSYLSYSNFNDNLLKMGKGVYIIGLDFHTGFIINDGKENLFIHSNYIGRKGVTKEPVLASAALYSSKTRWLVCLTRDKGFIRKWMKV